MGRDETGRQRLVWDVEGIVVPRRTKNRSGNRRLGAEPMAPSGALPCIIGASGWYRCPSPGGRRAPSKADPLGGDQQLGSSPKASDLVSCASAAPRPRCSARATRAGCRSESHQKNWGAKRRHGHPYCKKCCDEARRQVPAGSGNPTPPGRSGGVGLAGGLIGSRCGAGPCGCPRWQIGGWHRSRRPRSRPWIGSPPPRSPSCAAPGDQ